MPEVRRGERRIHYEVSGSGSPMVLIPGIACGAELFGALPRRFARAGFQCITFDPVGIAPSSPFSGTYDLDAAGRDVLAILDDLGLERGSLVGTSLGGKVALCAANQAPERIHRIVLLGAAAVTTPRSRRIDRFMEVLAERLQPAEIGEVLAAFLFGQKFQLEHAQVVDDYARSLRMTDTLRELMVAQARASRSFDGAAATANLSCACLCIAGEQDCLVPGADVAKTAARMPQGIFEEIPLVGHALLLEAPVVFDRLTAFLTW